MKSKWLLYPTVALLLILTIALGVIAVFRSGFPKTHEQSELAESAAVTSGLDSLPDYAFNHITGEAVVDFEEGNEVYLAPDLLPYLERMEKGVPATDGDGFYLLHDNGELVYDSSATKHVEGVLDNLITLINHFARKGYSMEASHQLQRFYVMYYDCFLNTSYEVLTSNLAKCFPLEGADPTVLQGRIEEVFGIYSGDGFAFVFNPLQVADIRVEFCCVTPPEVALPFEEEALCQYDLLENDDVDGYECHLESWLHHMIRTAKDASLDEERIYVAQMLYAGSLANAEYRPDWAEAIVKCLSVEDWNFDSLKYAVETEFGVSLDHNVLVRAYFDARNEEMKHDE